VADAQVAGVVAGARTPIILVSRTDNTLTRLSSCALALLLVHHKRALASAASAGAAGLDS